MPVAPAWFPHQDPSFAPFPPPVNQQQPVAYYGEGGYDFGDGGGYGYDGYGYEQYGGYEMGAQQGGEMPVAPPPTSFNAGAKEFVPGGFSS